MERLTIVAHTHRDTLAPQGFDGQTRAHCLAQLQDWIAALPPDICCLSVHPDVAASALLQPVDDRWVLVVRERGRIVRESGYATFADAALDLVGYAAEHGAHWSRPPDPHLRPDIGRYHAAMLDMVSRTVSALLRLSHDQLLTRMAVDTARRALKHGDTEAALTALGAIPPHETAAPALDTGARPVEDDQGV